ncbi:MAG: YfhO family protein [Oscillospiraceae bacterium]|nr:YfhO family protein [Oscillospiraceae bacterium]
MTSSPLLSSGGGGKKSFFARHEYLTVFLVGLFVSFVMFLPALIMGKGLFTYFGDYLVQQIPFYKHCHEMVRSGSFLWDWGTDLGANFIGSYTFYLLGSPFFWLTIPFPNSWLPYLMAPLFFVKYATAGLTAYLYIKRFTAKKEIALLGALLYAFSGFQMYNIVFNHFNDVVALFPLMLVGLEELVTENKKGVFVLAVCINALCNYFFLVGEVVFLFLYFFIRMAHCSTWRITLKKFGLLAFESVLGCLLAGVLLMPSFLVVMSNPRVGSALTGFNMLFYSSEQRYGAILQSFLFPAEVPSAPNFFPGANNKWTSMAGWLPMFGLTGVFAYLTSKRKTWLKTIIITSAVMMYIPFLNSMFIAMNGYYYCRWFFMPILMMSLATALSLEDPKVNFKRGVRISALLTGIMVLAVGFLPASGASAEVDPSLTGVSKVLAKLKVVLTEGLGLYEDAGRFFLSSAIALISLAMVWLLVTHLRKSKQFISLALVCTILVTCVTGISYILTCRTRSGNHDFVREDLVNSRLELPVDYKENFYRVDFPDSFDNVGIYWNYPSVTTFHSIVPRSIMDFYPITGTKRDVGSRPELELYGIRAMASTRYYFKRGTSYDESDPPMPGYEYRFTSNDVTVWENTYYIPMGFTYTHSITKEELMDYAEEDRDKVMLHALCLSEKDAQKYADLLVPLKDTDYYYPSESGYFADCRERKEGACDSFAYSSSGFEATITTEKPELVFFSVPYEEGWTATVNGKAAEIVISNIGFMSVVVPEGSSRINFSYRTPGLDLGLWMTFGALAVYLVYLALVIRNKKKHPEQAEKVCPTRCSECTRCFANDRYSDLAAKGVYANPFAAEEETVEADEESAEASLLDAEGEMLPESLEAEAPTETETEEEKKSEGEKEPPKEQAEAVAYLEKLYEEMTQEEIEALIGGLDTEK